MALTKIKTGSVSDSITLTTPTIDGVLTANAGVVVDNFTLDGTTLALSSGDMTLDAAGDIILDADSDIIRVYASGTHFGSFYSTSNDFLIYSAASDKDIIFQGNDGGSTVTALTLDMSAAGAATFNARLGIGVNPTYPLHVSKAAASDWAAKIENSSATNPYGLIVRFSGAAPDNNIRHFFLCSDTGATRLIIQSDGDVQNHDNSYGAISDERVKQDITDASSQWDDIKALRVRNYKMKDDVREYGDNAKFKLGLISQEAELVSPHIIAESAAQKNDIESSSDFGSLYVEGDTIPEGSEVGDIKERLATVKAIKYSILYMKAIKALQEAQTRIESLETLTESLTARITALEGA
jgi:hypothetical protein